MVGIPDIRGGEFSVTQISWWERTLHIASWHLAQSDIQVSRACVRPAASSVNRNKLQRNVVLQANRIPFIILDWNLLIHGKAVHDNAVPCLKAALS